MPRVHSAGGGGAATVAVRSRLVAISVPSEA